MNATKYWNRYLFVYFVIFLAINTNNMESNSKSQRQNSSSSPENYSHANYDDVNIENSNYTIFLTFVIFRKNLSIPISVHRRLNVQKWIFPASNVNTTCHVSMATYLMWVVKWKTAFSAWATNFSIGKFNFWICHESFHKCF